MSVVDILRKTLEVGDEVFVTNRSNTYDLCVFGKVVDFSENRDAAYVQLKGSKNKKGLLRESRQIMCITQQLKYNKENYPENLL